MTEPAQISEGVEDEFNVPIALSAFRDKFLKPSACALCRYSPSSVDPVVGYHRRRNNGSPWWEPRAVKGSLLSTWREGQNIALHAAPVDS